MMTSPAQVGHEVKRPMKAPIPPNQPSPEFLVRNLRAKAAKLALRPTSHESVRRRSKLIGMRRSPRCWVIYTTASGVCPTGPQQVATATEGVATRYTSEKLQAG